MFPVVLICLVLWWVVFSDRQFYYLGPWKQLKQKWEKLNKKINFLNLSLVDGKINTLDYVMVDKTLIHKAWSMPDELMLILHGSKKGFNPKHKLMPHRG